MNTTTNIVIGVLAIGFIIFIVWLGGMPQKRVSQIPDTTATTTPETSQPVETKPVTTTTNKPMTTATIKTNKGVITLELLADKSPKTVANFTKLAGEGFYNGTRFHRVIKGFMIQGGDPLSKDLANQNRWGTGGPGYSFEDEIDGTNHNDIGTIAMANSGPNTNGSQFFINTAPNNFLDTKHTVFGKVTGGMEVVKAIEGTKTGANDRPVEDMLIESITIK